MVNKLLNGKILVLKYGNRKLYCPVVGSYITLSEFVDLVKENKGQVVVQDNKTKKDVTQTTLLSTLVHTKVHHSEVVPFLTK